jgi:hypothetical protein
MGGSMTSNPLCLAYIAGFFDGEGCCSLCRSSTSSVAFIPAVTFTNSNLELLKLLSKHLDLGFIQTEARSIEGRKQVHKLWFPANQVAKFLQAIRPYLILKAKQADLILEYILDLKQPHGTSEQPSDVNLKRRKEIYNELAALNQRGM